MAAERFLAIVAAFLIVSVNADTKILGGEEATIGDFNYVASVRLDATHECAGSIISDQYILTTAQCVTQNGRTVRTSVLTVRVGSSNQLAAGSIRNVAAIKVHPEFSDRKNNLALLQLQNPLTWSTRIASVPFATNNAQLPKAEDTVTVAGWGRQTTEDTMPYRLHSIQLQVASDATCLSAYSAYTASTDLCLTHGLQSGNCVGDGGNAAIYNGVLVGVNNFVVGACGSRYPDVFTNVLPYAEWINQTISV